MGSMEGNSGKKMEITLHHDQNPHFRQFPGFLGFFASMCVLIFNRWLKIPISGISQIQSAPHRTVPSAALKEAQMGSSTLRG